MSSLNEIKSVLDKAQNIVILIHEDPDGDAIGAGIAMYHALCSENKRVILPYFGVIRETANSLNPQEILIRDWPETFSPDLVLILDSADLDQLDNHTRQRLESLSQVPWVNIDHHVSNKKFAEVNYVDPTASSTCEIIAQYLLKVNYILSAHTAGFLLGGIVSDTGRFAYKNTTPRTMETAAALMSLGADLSQITQDLESRISFNGIQLWGHVLSNTKIVLSGQVVLASVSQMTYQKTEDADLLMREVIAFLRRTKGIKLAVLFKETEAGSINISLRSYGDVNCSLIAQNFGGGGHLGAAGGRFKGSIWEAEKAMLSFLENGPVGLA